MKTLLRWLAGIVGSILLLIALLAIAIYIPPIQNFVVKKVAQAASESTGLEIGIDHVRLSFPLDLLAEGVLVTKPNNNDNDTIAKIESVKVGVELLPLLSGDVKAEELLLKGVQFSTSDLIAQLVISGKAEKIRLHGNDFNLKTEEINLDDVLLATAKVNIHLVDTIVEDTTQSETLLKIGVRQLKITDSDVAFSTASDSLRAFSSINEANAERGIIDLHKEIYAIKKADFNVKELRYDQTFEPYIDGFDYNHITLNTLLLGADSISYSNDELFLNVKKGSFKETTGLTLTQLNGVLRLGSTSLYIPHLSLKTTSSSLFASGSMALNAFDETNNAGNVSLKAKAEIGRSDLMLFLTDMPQAFKTAYPPYPLNIEADLFGNMNHLSVNSLSASLPTSFQATARGYVGNLTNPSDLIADLDLDIGTQNVNFLTSAFLDKDLQETISIPRGTSLVGNVKVDGSIYTAKVKLAEGGGSANIDGSCYIADTKTFPDVSYNADITTTNLPLGHFIKGMDLAPLSIVASVSGAGSDFFDNRTSLKGNVEIKKFNYDDFDLEGTKAEVKVEKSVASATITSVNEILNGTISIDALLHSDDVKGTLSCSLDNLDLEKLGVAQVPLTTSLCAHIDLESDLKESHAMRGFISDVVIKDSANQYRAYDLEIDAFTRPDTTLCQLSSGDFDLHLNASGGYRSLTSVGSNLYDELLRQVDRKYISQDTLKQKLPIGRLRLQSGKDNFVYGYAKRLGYDFNKIDIDVSSSPQSGINGFACVDSLCAFGYEVDSVRLDVKTEDDIFNYYVQAKNNKSNELYCFKFLSEGSLFATGSNLKCKLYDRNDKLGLSLALSASLEHDGILVSLTDEEAILGYEKFNANKGNYVFMKDGGRISANLHLSAADGTGLQIYSNDDDKDALQDVTLGINNLDLTPIIAVIPYCPEIKGVLSGDFHVVQKEKDLSISAEVGVKNFEYEGTDLGDLHTEFVYSPVDNSTHYLDGILSHNGEDVGTIRGTYVVGDKDDLLQADVELNHLPLNLANGFIPDQIVGLKGFGDGSLKIDGSLSDLQINGTIDLDSAYLVSVPYGIELNIDDKQVRIKDSKVLLEDFKLYSHNEQPLVVNGEVDCSDLANMTTHLRMTATNWLIIDAKENRKSEAFGKAYVNLDALATGPLASLKIYGSVDVLGSTDLTYILRDSPISTDNAMEGLVEFADLSQEEEHIVTRPTVEGPYIDLRISVAKDAHVFCALNTIKTNYIDMVGGGDLRMIYSSNDIRLTGRYTIEDGEMKYSLPVIPLKTFTIAKGSYVEFTGDVLDPSLSIVATETTKSNAMVNGVSQSVTFNCGVSISQTLNKMGLEFIIEAPENTTIDSELQAMTSDERSKIAVTLLTTGMYLSDNSLSSFSMNSALSSFLQSEINNISSNALRTIDLSIGIDNTTDEVGATHTDYTFKFAKRFWGNRMRIVIGGKVSSNDASAENLIDNVAFEYRLDKNAYTNLRLFYDRSTYDFLEGYVGQYGVGVLWRRQLQSLKELFHKNKKVATQEPVDSLTTTKEGIENE